MKAVVTTGMGGYEHLQYQDVPVPEVLPGTVLLKVLSAGINATDINTRLGWMEQKDFFPTHPRYRLLWIGGFCWFP
jgi:NADPH:quinone reductase-like Zn-dependent oxidoreductase